MANFQFTRPQSFPPIVKNLIIINALVYAAQALLDKQYNVTGKLMMWPLMPERLHSLLEQNNLLSETERFYPYQIVTHMFFSCPAPGIFSYPF